MSDSETNSLLARIAAALERMAPAGDGATDPDAFPAYGWDGSVLHGQDRIAAPALDLLRGIDRQRDTVSTNVRRLAQGAEAHDMLLWGARGMGKSALVRSSVSCASAAGSWVATGTCSQVLKSPPP